MLDGIDHTRLVRFAETLVGKQDAEDVVQDVYLKFLSDKVPAFRGESERYTWLCAVVKHTALRRKAQQRGLALEPRETCTIPHYDEWIDAKQRVSELPKRDRDVLLTYASHGSYRCVARALGLTRTQVRGRLERARRRLRKQSA